MVRTYITTNLPAAWAAAKWLRTSLEIPASTNIIPEFEKEFNCTIDYQGDFAPIRIHFATEQDRMWFLLKWS